MGLDKQEKYFLYPDWNVSARVRACVTTRAGGVSKPPFESLNLATHVGDDPVMVDKNRAILRERLKLPAEPRWLEQVHGTNVADSECVDYCQADAFYTDQENVVCAVMTADCLPVFFASEQGDEVAVAHAGWKGLLQGVIEKTAKRFTAPAEQLHVWLGPAIGPEQFEIGGEVRQAFLEESRADRDIIEAAFSEGGNNKWLADIYALARARLERIGITHVTGGEFCTVTDSQMFYSYRRDGQTGRMASLVWLEQPVDTNF